MTVGERIKAARISAKMTQAELAKKLEISYVVISQYENGKRNPKLETLQKIADALEVPVSDLLGLPTPANSDSPELTNQLFDNLVDKLKRNQLNEAFDKLNDKGQQKALEQVSDLTKITDYQKDENA